MGTGQLRRWVACRSDDRWWPEWASGVSASTPAPQRRRLLYVCLERIVAGSAAATHVHAICDGLAERGFEVILKAEHGGTRGNFFEQMRRYRRIVWQAWRTLSQVDAVYVRAHFAGFPIALVARLMQKPVIQEINGVYVEAFVTHPQFAPLRHVLSWTQRKQYQWSHAIIAVTRDLVEWGSREAGHDRAFWVGNGADTALFRPDGPRAKRDRPYALFFGGLARWHGVEVMVKAARSPSWPEGVDLVIAGPVVDESLRSALRNLPPNAVWLGPISHTELPELIRGAVASLIPTIDPRGITHYGITPLKLFEALACGVPAVVSDFKGMADIVREGRCGLVIPTNDAEALASAVAELAADPERSRSLGKAGASLIAANHSWATRADETAIIIRKAISAG